MFSPVNIESVLSAEDRQMLRDYIADADFGYRRYDDNCKRELISDPILETYFSKNLEPLAQKIFKDATLKTSFTMYAKYDQNSSMLPNHKDRGACTYTIDYCLSSNVDWPLMVDNQYYSISEGDGLAFMGVDSIHGRQPLDVDKDVSVEMVFFHFVPENHWYFDHCKGFELDS